MKLGSVWKSDKKDYPALCGDAERDVVVIGGGIAGYLTAFRLAEEGQFVTLIEADRLFSGTTGRTTAKITYNQGGVYFDLYSRYGEDTARAYYKAQSDGMLGLKKLQEKFLIECDWSETNGYIFSCGPSARLKKTFEVMKKIGAPCEWEDGLARFDANCAIKSKRQYLFDPLKFLCALPVRFEIFEHTRALDVDVENKTVLTENGKIRAKKIIVATHFPIINPYGAYFLKLRQSTSYTVAINKKLTDEMFLEEKSDGISVRPYAGGTLFGGGDHRTGRIRDVGHFLDLKNTAEKLYGADTVTNCWSAEDVMTFDGMPMAGQYANGTDGVYVITGFNKWGMANAMTCAELICDLALGKENEYAELFSPQRKVKGSTGAFVSNALTNVKEITMGYFRLTTKTSEDVAKGTGAIVKHNGKKRAVYRDEEDNLHIIGSMCPHMHGELKWNADTHTWDCPCHGSRFDIFGNILSEPASKCCKYEKQTKKEG
jgi:glycine/D-amino acid oxidase-like deaminating enzyme/nitrite reductase/ring-hydroxylating ferredoxin subunit